MEVNRGQRVARNGHFNIRLGMKDEDGSKTAGGGALNIPLQSNLADLKYFSGKTST